MPNIRKIRQILHIHRWLFVHTNPFPTIQLAAVVIKPYALLQDSQLQRGFEGETMLLLQLLLLRNGSIVSNVVTVVQQDRFAYQCRQCRYRPTGGCALSGSSRCLSKKRALKRTGKFGSKGGNGKADLLPDLPSS